MKLLLGIGALLMVAALAPMMANAANCFWVLVIFVMMAKMTGKASRME